MSVPELIIVGGTRFGTAGAEPGGLAVIDGLISAVGPDDELRNLAGPRTEVVDLAGGFVLPGFQDAHVHPGQGGWERAGCDLTGSGGRAGYVARITAHAATLPVGGWVLGGGWSMDAFPGGVPTAGELDPLTGGRPAYLPNRDHHSAWVNTEALRRAGIDAHTPDPVDGRIERDAAGNPTGALHEGAMHLVGAIVPTPDIDDLRRALLTGQAYLHSLGITGWQDAIVGDSPLMPDFFDAYLELDAAGLLTARVAGALWWDRGAGVEQLPFLVDRRAQSGGARFSAPAVKIMLDGVCETGTAALLADYLHDGRPDGNRGMFFVDPDRLADYATALDAAGFGIHLHALGDAAVRVALDALEYARKENGPSDNRHHIAHLQVVDPADVPRFGRLDVTANCQALWACADPPMTELTLPVLGEPRSSWQYPFGAIHAAGGRLALGSDWPVSSPDPLAIVQTAVTRTVPDEAGGSPFLPGQRLDLTVALTAATAGSAHVNRLDDRTGRLRPGFAADLALLDRDPFTVLPTEIADLQVVGTIVAGRWVHRASDGPL